MGSGSKFQFQVVPAIGLGIHLCRFPHQLSVTINVLCFCLYLGFGKGYDELG